MNAEERAEKKREYNRRRYLEKKAEISEKAKVRYAENSEKIRAAVRQYRTENAEVVRKRKAAYNAAHPEVNKARNDRWNKANPERMKERQAKHRKRRRKEIIGYHRSHYQRNRERILEKAKLYRIENPDIYRKAAMRRRAIKRGAPIEDLNAIADWDKAWRSKRSAKCHWCQGKFKIAECHADHVIPLSKGGSHSVSNLCVSCAKCNLSKSDKDPGDFSKECRQPLLFV